MRDAITYYTNVEGGDFIMWPLHMDFIPADGMLDLLKKKSIRVPRKVNNATLAVYKRFNISPSTILIKYEGIEFHSFITRNGRRWDAINGWNKGYPLVTA